jgi:hypothetical protein
MAHADNSGAEELGNMPGVQSEMVTMLSSGWWHMMDQKEQSWCLVTRLQVRRVCWEVSGGFPRWQDCPAFGSPEIPKWHTDTAWSWTAVVVADQKQAGWRHLVVSRRSLVRPCRDRRTCVLGEQQRQPLQQMCLKMAKMAIESFVGVGSRCNGVLRGVARTMNWRLIQQRRRPS